ncbi:MAG: sigma 54-interacting transcriptional regulator [Myxococcota bacterium]
MNTPDPRDTRTAEVVAPTTGAGLKLVVLDGPGAGTEVGLVRRVVVGSAADADLVLDDPTVSRRHSVFSLADGMVRIRDLGSRNGTFIGSTGVQDGVVQEGTVVRVGETHLALRPSWVRPTIAPSSARRFGELYGTSVAMRSVFSLLERAAPREVPVLIEGETGTGKDLAARSIHHASRRARKPFVVFDCASVPENLVESELFGHARGAFTGAHRDREGAFGRADGGTLFLDELGELPLSLQPKLLRAIESQQIRSVGANDTRQVDVRLIAATNRNLRAEVERGAFRGDLLYRLDVVRVHMPALRHRPADIEGLVTDLLMGHLPPGDRVAGPNLERLRGYQWPGNVRELRNVLQRALALADGEPRFDELVLDVGAGAVQPATFGLPYPGVAQPMPFKEAKRRVLEDFERAYLEALLRRFDGNHTRAAAAAEMSRKHLHDLVKRLQLRE